MSIAVFIIFMASSIGLLNTMFAPSICFREDEKHKETKRFFILLVFNFLLVLSIAIMIAQSKILMTTNI